MSLTCGICLILTGTATDLSYFYTGRFMGVRPLTTLQYDDVDSLGYLGRSALWPSTSDQKWRVTGVCQKYRETTV